MGDCLAPHLKMQLHVFERERCLIRKRTEHLAVVVGERTPNRASVMSPYTRPAASSGPSETEATAILPAAPSPPMPALNGARSAS